MNASAGALSLMLGLVLLGGCADDAPDPETTDFVVLVDDGTEEADMIEGEPGAYGLTPRGTSAAPYAVIDVPSGYASFGLWAVWPLAGEDHEDEEDSEFSTVEYWAVHGVYDDPCRWEGAAPRIGPTVDNLVAALSDQRHTEVTAGPEAVTLGGHDGVLISVTVPADLEISRCTEGRYMFWQGSPGDAHHQAPLGTTEQLWILDVDGQRVVLGTAATAGIPGSEVAELTAMVESVRFVER